MRTTAKAFDWAGVHAKLAAAETAVEGRASLSEAQGRDTLRARAAQLARPLEAVASNQARLELVVFTLAGGTYALESQYLCEAARRGEIVPLPDAPPAVLGVTNLRGEVLPVFDLAHCLGLPAGASAATSTGGEAGHLLVLGRTRPELGVLVGAVHEAMSLALSDLAPPPANQGQGRSTVRGLARAGTTSSDNVLVLDGEALLADPQLTIDDPAEARS